MAEPLFTAKDAQDLIDLARSAPIPNMGAADARREFLNRFAVWANSIFFPPPPPPPPPPPDVPKE